MCILQSEINDMCHLQSDINDMCFLQSEINDMCFLQSEINEPRLNKQIVAINLDEFFISLADQEQRYRSYSFDYSKWLIKDL